MSFNMPPLVGITGDTLPGPYTYYKIGDKYILSIVEAAGCVAVMIPPIGDKLDMDALLDRLDGVVFTGSPANIEPHHYGAESVQPEEKLDRGRDATNLPLLSKVIERGMPFFCICRGHQELNVVRGGTLHQFVHEIDGNQNHLADPDLPFDDQYQHLHSIMVEPDGVLSKMFPINTPIPVNSVHEQAVDRLGGGLQVEARAEDGVVEAMSLVDYPNFMMSVQWHPEHRQVIDEDINRKLFEAFGESARGWMQKKNI